MCEVTTRIGRMEAEFDLDKRNDTDEKVVTFDQSVMDSESDPATLPQRADGLLSLKWNGFQHHLIDSLVSLFRSESLTDVTLVPDNGEPIKAHKIVLALSSPYFRKLFQDNPCKHPIVILKGMKFQEVQQVMNFIYMGQVHIRENEFEEFMEAAESMRIDGINPNSSNLSDIVDSHSPNDRSPLTFDPRHSSGTSPLGRRDEPHPHHIPWLLSQSNRSVEVDAPLDNPLGDSFYDKRSSVSSGISSGTVGSLDRCRGTSMSLSPPMNLLQHPHTLGTLTEEGALNKTRSISTEPILSHTPVVIDLDEEEQERPQAHRNVYIRNRHRRFSVPAPPEQEFIDLSLQSKHDEINKAEDLSKSSRQDSPDHAYELSLTESSSFRTATGLVITTPTFLSYRHEKRSTSWPMENQSSSSSLNTENQTPLFSHLTSKGHSSLSSMSPVHRYHPFMSSTPTIPRPIPQHPMLPQFNMTRPSTVTTEIPLTPSTFNFSSQREDVTKDSRRFSDSTQDSLTTHSSTTQGYQQHRRDLLNSRVKISSRSNFYNSNTAGHFLTKYGMSTGVIPSSNFTKPKTKAIRSSQVPQSARYTATQVDTMVEKVENFPGPLVPCIVCQKFVKRERLRAHIHECHLLPEEKIECPICKIGLKSKGSFRVHLWRHRRSKSSSSGDTKSRERSDRDREPSSSSV